ncbi:serine protease [Gloeothece verrucosa]|nr:serine protease [Gloeothece verrucosa]
MMKYYRYLPLLLTLSSLSLGTDLAAQGEISPPLIIAQSASYQGIVKQVDDIAQQITVRIDGTSGNGSGVIIAKNGQTYYVLTAAHVVSNPDTYQIITPDGQKYPLNKANITILEGTDLAVISFNSKQTYTAAKLANYDLKRSWIFVSGFPATNKPPQRRLTGGKNRTIQESDFQVKDIYSVQGQGLVYTNVSQGGMSGGPVLDRNGRVVGINTGAENELVFEKNQNYVELNLGFSLGVPIATFIKLLNKTGIQPQWITLETSSAAALTETEVNSIRNQLFNLYVPIKKEDALAWINYGNQLFRLEEFEKAITAFDQAITVLKSTPNPSSQTKQDLAKAYYAKGLTLWFTRDLSQSAQEFIHAIQQDDQFYSAWRWLGYDLFLMRNYTDALKVYNKLFEMNPKGDFVLYTERGSVLAYSGHYQEAIADYNKAIELKPHPWAYNKRGLAYSELEEYQKAIADFNKTIELEPDADYAYNNRGNVYKDLKDYDKALADYNKAISYNYVGAYNNRGNLYLDLKEYQKALADFNKGIEIDSENSLLYGNRGRVYSELKDYKKAFDDYSKAIEINPNQSFYYTLRARVSQDLKDYNTVIKDYTKVIELKPEQEKIVEAYANRAGAYQNLKEFQKALDDANKVIELVPDQFYGYVVRGGIYAESGDYQKTVDDYTKSIEIYPKWFVLYNRRGQAYFNLKQYQNALADYTKSVEIEPNIDGYFGRAIIYHKQGNYEAAVQDYKQILNLDQNNLATWNNLGLILYETGDIANAIKPWTVIVESKAPIAETQLALAVALYNQGEQEKGLALAENALTLDRRYSDVKYLQENLWGQKLIADTQKLLKHPRIQAFLSQKK